MAELRLSREQVTDPEAWPPVCAACGEPASGREPVPDRCAKGEQGLRVPVCERHAGMWDRHRRATRLAVLILLALVVLLPLALWQWLGPGPDLEKISGVVVLTNLAAVVVGVALLAWAAPCVRVTGTTPGQITLGGVSQKFVRAWEKATARRAELPATIDTARFEVRPYEPPRETPRPLILRAFLLLLGLAGVTGTAVAAAGVWLGQATAGWPADDPRFLPLIAAVLLAYAALGLWAGRITPRRVVCVAVGVLVLILTGCAGLAGLIGIFSFRSGLTLALVIPALLVMTVATLWLIRVYRLRHVPAAAAAGALGPLAVAAVAVAAAGSFQDPQKMLAPLGVGFAVVGGSVAANRARRPGCAECDEWMEARELGTLRRPRAAVEPVVAGGEIVRLAGEELLPAKEPPEHGDVELTLHSCPHCRQAGPLVLELTEVVVREKNQTTRRRVGRWSYPAAAWPVVDELFPPPKDETLPAGPDQPAPGGEKS